ncbi:cytochrome c oxidase subunit II [Lysinibacter sp. HNR]|uniref:aa3-type cytochrome oxidase subunit II n=1 Tax=Lysinibacter sp. HNR TaxID=3031408 RepID=UPI00243607D2|nr:cytochrome c oxidase subunit II [Lysinibacter sp. HNR]WGD36236.1 cytochrome c oxidase subunit II [Lysinibacter sp. HNR]
MRSNRRKKWVLAPLAVMLTTVLVGCTQQQLQGFMPGDGFDTTNHTNGIISLWVNSWIVLLGVGIITWGLIIWAVIVYRRRKGQTGVPAQLRYNMPIETFFTVVPLILVLGFFAFTAQEQQKIEARVENPDVTVQVVAKRWAWDFNYVDADVYYQGIQVQPDPTSDVQGAVDQSSFPVLYLPKGKTVELELDSIDIIHSFWVIDFLYKKDMFPGQTNYMNFTPQKTGTFEGKCAELCGEYHSMMLFRVKVVEQDEYDAYLESLREAGNVGYQLDDVAPGLLGGTRPTNEENEG